MLIILLNYNVADYVNVSRNFGFRGISDTILRETIIRVDEM